MKCVYSSTRINSTQKPHDTSDDDLPIEVSTKGEIPSEVNQQFVCQGDSNKRSIEESDDSTSSPPLSSMLRLFVKIFEVCLSHVHSIAF